MKRIKKYLLPIALLALTSTSVHATIMLNFGKDSTTTNPVLTGASGTVTIDFVDASGGFDMNMTIQNTTGLVPAFGAEATESNLVGLAFNIIDGATQVRHTGGTFLTDLGVDQSIGGVGTFDLCAQDATGTCQAGQNSGIDEGDSDSVVVGFNYGSDAAAAEAAFRVLLGDPPGVDSAMRFKGVNAGAGSDKLSNPDITPVPVPAAALLFGSALLGLVGVGRKRKTHATH